MTIDWTQPAVDARDMNADPLFDSQGRVQACRIGSVVYASPAFEKLGLRNVPPPKPEPVLLEGWVKLYAKDGQWPSASSNVFTSEDNARESVTMREPLAICKVAWMSDGSPVPASPEQFDQMREMAKLIQDRDHWKARAEALQAEVGSIKDATEWLCKEINRAADGGFFGGSIRLDRAKVLGDLGLEVLARHHINERIQGLQAEVERMKPVVDAAVAWGLNFSPLASERLVGAVRVYQSQQDPAEPVKTCTTCRHWKELPLISCLMPEICNWEPRHD